ncbi:MAG: hypothetical protein JSR45_13910 [Proteobacteria bacterium]|nr:hypothetical protein [Pseudomonadota bacterium]
MSASQISPEPGRRSGALLSMGLTAALGLGLLWLIWTRGHGLSWADKLALIVSLMCLASAIRIGLESLDPRRLSQRMSLEGESTPAETAQVRLQAGVVALMGVVIALPPLADMLGWRAPEVIYGVFLAYAAIRIVYARHVLKTADEFVRRRMERAALVIMMLFQTGLLLVAGAERLGLIGPVSGWDALVCLTTLAVLTPVFLQSRRQAEA